MLLFLGTISVKKSSHLTFLLLSFQNVRSDFNALTLFHEVLRSSVPPITKQLMIEEEVHCFVLFFSPVTQVTEYDGFL